MAELGEIFNRFTLVVHDNVAAGRVIVLNMEAAVADSHKRNELVVIVLDEKNVAVTDAKATRRLWNNEDLLCLGIFHFASRRITAHVYISPIGFEWIKHQTGFPRYRLSHGKLCCWG